METRTRNRTAADKLVVVGENVGIDTTADVGRVVYKSAMGRFLKCTSAAPNRHGVCLLVFHFSAIEPAPPPQIPLGWSARPKTHHH